MQDDRPEKACLHAVVYGLVQGVNFRTFVKSRATRLGVTGLVRNVRDTEAVEVRAEGERRDLEQLLSYLHQGPPAARVKNVSTTWRDYKGEFSNFNIEP